MLNYIRKATKSKDGSKGELYVHHFNAGYQFLVFPNHEAARNFQINTQ